MPELRTVYGMYVQNYWKVKHFVSQWVAPHWRNVKQSTTANSWHRVSPPHMKKALFIETSNRKTYSLQKTAASRFWILVSPSSRKPKAGRYKRTFPLVELIPTQVR